ncbi:hypothetical protein E2C01_101035 [Portunus trituberculatus]|uniref:Uncharacterized protein n=1 Tax=Portunus trituberculatus TaxID=210409 RepID=A0A5B7KDP8_PORTR|nr:hypothetical protein [Portunus trituberculatus]
MTDIVISEAVFMNRAAVITRQYSRIHVRPQESASQVPGSLGKPDSCYSTLAKAYKRSAGLWPRRQDVTGNRL